MFNIMWKKRMGRAHAQARNRTHRAPGGWRRSGLAWRVRPCSPPSSRERSRQPGIDFFPLTVNYQEKTYAAGKIPGGYFKREGRPTEKETLISRLIDRPIRPLFVPGYRNETQVIVTVLSHDLENDPDVVGMVAASAALTLSGIPFMGPDRRGPGRRDQRRLCPQPDDVELQQSRSRPRRRRHRRRRADGRVRRPRSCPRR